MSTTGQVPVVAGLFEQGPNGVRLVGSRCAGCNTLYFPVAFSCRNPICHDKRLAAAHLPERGTLVSYTVQHYQPPPLFRMDEWAPYAIGLVALGEGVEVMGMLTGVAVDQIAIGMQVRLTTETLFTDAERGSVVTYKFAPCLGEPTT
ncbi:OB-fold domain-containing protein [Novosphingobium sp.]|uniref:Zn-ribbon domain-containing OB-fold protein n=1 Tax=Novosphingobium sp. TaxID=1874826 RepID=UPI0026342F84|nr:OB-fold domain-containing protein [Novosphingobium sp.]